MIRCFRRLLSYCITGVISFISYDVGAATRDSSLTKPLRAKTYLYSALSASYATSSNWQGQNLRNFAFVGNVLSKPTQGIRHSPPHRQTFAGSVPPLIWWNSAAGR